MSVVYKLSFIFHFRYIYYVKKHIQALLDMGCHVIMVFDGRPLPAKKVGLVVFERIVISFFLFVHTRVLKGTNDGRRQKRADNMRAGELLMSQGRKDEAVSKFQQAVTLTPDIVESTVEVKLF